MCNRCWLLHFFSFAHADPKQDQTKGAHGKQTPQKSPGSGRRSGRGGGTPSGRRQAAQKANGTDNVGTAEGEKVEEGDRPGASGAGGSEEVGKQGQDGVGEKTEKVGPDVGKLGLGGVGENAGKVGLEQGPVAKPGAGEGSSASRGEKKVVPVTLPDKLPRNKVCAYAWLRVDVNFWQRRKGRLCRSLAAGQATLQQKVCSMRVHASICEHAAACTNNLPVLLACMHLCSRLRLCVHPLCVRCCQSSVQEKMTN